MTCSDNVQCFQVVVWLAGHIRRGLQGRFYALATGGFATWAAFVPGLAIATANPSSGGQSVSERLFGWSEARVTELSFGALVGDPTALTSRIFLGPLRAFSFQLGRNFGRLSGYHASGDLLRYIFDPFGADLWELDLYWGPGLTVNLWERDVVSDDVGRVERHRESQWGVGLRGVLGFSTYVPSPLLELSAEVAPTLNVGSGTTVGLQFGAGVLYRIPIENSNSG